MSHRGASIATRSVLALGVYTAADLPGTELGRGTE
jgi:hypothetical protein